MVSRGQGKAKGDAAVALHPRPSRLRMTTLALLGGLWVRWFLVSTQKPPRVWQDAVRCCIEEVSAAKQRRPSSISELLLTHIRKYRNFGWRFGYTGCSERWRRAATVNPGPTVLERLYAVRSSLEYVLAEILNVARLCRDEDDGLSQESVHVASKALLRGISPPDIMANVESPLEFECNWETDPGRVLAVLVTAATADRKKIDVVGAGRRTHGGARAVGEKSEQAARGGAVGKQLGQRSGGRQGGESVSSENCWVLRQAGSFRSGMQYDLVSSIEGVSGRVQPSNVGSLNWRSRSAMGWQRYFPRRLVPLRGLLRRLRRLTLRRFQRCGPRQ